MDLSHLFPVPEDLDYPSARGVSESVKEEVLRRAREVSERLSGQRTILSWISSHSVEPAELSELGLREPDEISTAGLLHDIGKIIALNAWPEQFQDLFDSVHFSGHDTLTREIEKLGIDHAGLGGEIAQTWGLPSHTSLMITNHHEPSYIEPSELKGEPNAECRVGIAVLLRSLPDRGSALIRAAEQDRVPVPA